MRGLRNFVLSLVALACATSSAQEPELTADQRYRRGKSLFDIGDCAPAVEMLQPLAVPGKLQDDKAQLDVHLMLGVCYVLSNKELEASREFSSLLAIDPDFNPDPFLVPPPVIEVYERQKAAMKEQLAEIRRVREASRAAAEENAQGAILVERTTVIKDVPMAVAFMPLGLAQAANGENVKAVIIGGVQGIALLANASMFWTQVVTQAGRPYNELSEAEQGTYDVLAYGHLIALVGFGVAYGYGVADALWNREDGAVLEKKQTRRALTPAELKEVRKIPAAPTPSTGAGTGALPPPPPDANLSE